MPNDKRKELLLKEALLKFFLLPFVGITRIRFDGYFSAFSCEAPLLQKERLIIYMYINTVPDLIEI